MVDPLSYFPFQPVLHNCCNKDRGMCYLVYGMVHINCTKFLSFKCAYISLWLNPMGHSKLHSTLNTLHLLPTLVRLFVLPCTHQCRRSPPPFISSPFFSLSQTEELACDRHVPHQLALNVHLKHSDLTSPTLAQWFSGKVISYWAGRDWAGSDW